MKYHGNLSSDSRADTRGETDGRTDKQQAGRRRDKYDDGFTLFSQLHDRTLKNERKERKKRVLYIYRVRIKSFPDYKHSIQENYCTWNIFFLNLTQEVFF